MVTYTKRKPMKAMSQRTGSRVAAQQTRAQSARQQQFSASRAASTAAQAVRTGGWANPTSGAEKKFNDVSATFAPTASAVTFTAGTLLNGVATGTDASSRIGRKAVIKSILLRITTSLATGTKGGAFRILCVYDKQANATAPAITDILLADAFNSPNNLTYRDRFVTIFDQVTDPVDAGGPNERAFTCYKKLNLETLWNAGTDALIGSIASGSIYLFVAQSGSIATNAPSVTIRSRVRYTDN